jgi:hypothetical protein
MGGCSGPGNHHREDKGEEQVERRRGGSRQPGARHGHASCVTEKNEGKRGG